MTIERPSFNPTLFLAKDDEGRSVTSYRKEQIVFSQGERADAVYYLRKGRVKATVVSEEGKEAVIAILGADEFFGEGCLAGQAKRMATVTTMTDAVVVRLEKATIVRLNHQTQAFSERFIAHILRRTRHVEADLVDQLFDSSEKRLARLLLLLANFGKDGEPESTIEKITQETLAAMVGTTPSRVSYFMNKFRNLRYIDYSGSGDIKIYSSLSNVVLGDQPQITTPWSAAFSDGWPVTSRKAPDLGSSAISSLVAPEVGLTT